LCPVAEEATLADVATAWNVPVLIVARRGLGTINHTLLTIESIRARQLPIAGVILNEAIPVGDDASVADNAAEIERRSGVPVLGEIPHGSASELLRAGRPVRIRWRELLSVVSGPLSVETSTTDD
jgi:dethiobiotin synthetase